MKMNFCSRSVITTPDAPHESPTMSSKSFASLMKLSYCARVTSSALSAHMSSTCDSTSMETYLSLSPSHPKLSTIASMSFTPSGGSARYALMASLTLESGTVSLEPAAVKPCASANGRKLSITQRTTLKPVSSRLSSAVRSSLRVNLRSSHTCEILRWHSGLNSNASLNTASPTFSGSTSWFTPDWSSVSTPQVKRTERPSSLALSGNSLLRMVMEYCSGCFSSRNCSAVLVGSSFVTYTMAGISHASNTSRISTRPLTLSTKSANDVLKN
mmetsp:Transcript_96820/g.144999  ORF Transcript_96820/g.144999 Transcript_96820/m.144999 type:complete len:271 (-) Transcript_96820:7-819(-)